MNENDSVFVELDKLGKIPEGMKCVYVLGSSSGLVKIGVSKECKKRKRALETQSGFTFVNEAYTYPMANASKIESMAHKHFSKNKKLGEWYEIPFDCAKKKVNALSLQFGDTNTPIGSSEESIREFAKRLVYGFDLRYLPEERNAMDDIKEENEVLYNYMVKNGYVAEYEENGDCNVHMFIDGERVDMSLRLFLAITYYTD